jgi:hypothetical protein
MFRCVRFRAAGKAQRPTEALMYRKQPILRMHSYLRTFWLESADAVSVWRETGAGDGKRTHVSRPAPLDGSITYRPR